MERTVTIRQWIENFKSGKYSAPDRNTQIDAGWYDWFCKDNSLALKTKKLGNKLIAISKSKKFNIDKTYVVFKNNCPFDGKLYDDLRICDIDTGNVLYIIIPSSGHKSKNGKAIIFDATTNDYIENILTWKDIKSFFLND